MGVGAVWSVGGLDAVHCGAQVDRLGCGVRSARCERGLVRDRAWIGAKCVWVPRLGWEGSAVEVGTAGGGVSSAIGVGKLRGGVGMTGVGVGSAVGVGQVRG